MDEFRVLHSLLRVAERGKLDMTMAFVIGLVTGLITGFVLGLLMPRPQRLKKTTKVSAKEQVAYGLALAAMTGKFRKNGW